MVGSAAMSAPLVLALPDAPDPAACCARLAALGHRVLLDSAARDARLGRYSFLSADPVACVTEHAGRVHVADRRTGEAHVASSGDALDAVRAILAPHRAAPVPGLPPFQGGAAGWLAYEWGSARAGIPTAPRDDLGGPEAAFGVYDWVLAWDHAANRAWLVSTGLPEREPAARAARAQARADQVLAVLTGDAPPALGTRACGAPLERAAPDRWAPTHPVQHAGWPAGVAVRSTFAPDAFERAVARVRDYVHAGDVFQANLAQRLDAACDGAAWALYERLRARNAAPFAAWLDAADGPVLSASPERFLRVDADGVVETRPIKGTRPRGRDRAEDDALGRELLASEKDRAENVMIVDLMRNDLSRACAPGTVRVTELCALERYARVQHLVSTITGRLAPGTDALDLLRAAFPGGSITGAPKRRAMEIIAELEPTRRGVYCGAIGYWSVTGALDTSIAIRTATVRAGRVAFGVGGGIVADSDPGAERVETLDKARGMVDALVPDALAPDALVPDAVVAP